MMIDVIDEDAEMAVNLEEEIEIRLDTGSVVLEDAVEEQSLGDALEEKAFQRLKIRVPESKEKMDRELKEKIESDMAKMKSTPLSTTSLDCRTNAASISKHTSATGVRRITPLPNLGDLPPPTLPLPSLEKNVTCNACNASFTVKDLMLKRMPCPVCGEVCEF